MKLAALLAAGAVFFLAAAAQAQEDRDLKRCAKIGDNSTRLSCYDRLAKKRGVAPEEDRDSAWVVQEQAGGGGGKDVFLHVKATKEISSGWESAVPELWITCSGGAAQVYLNVGVFLHSELIRVVSRLDKQRSINDTYTVSQDGKIAFLAIGAGAASVAKSMAKRKRMAVRVQPYKQKMLNIEFPLTGLDEALPPLAEACGW